MRAKGKKTPCNNNGMSWIVLEWIYFQWYQRRDKESWSKVIVREPWESLVRGHPGSYGQSFGRMKVDSRLCLANV